MTGSKSLSFPMEPTSRVFQRGSGSGRPGPGAERAVRPGERSEIQLDAPGFLHRNGNGRVRLV